MNLYYQGKVGKQIHSISTKKDSMSFEPGEPVVEITQEALLSMLSILMSNNPDKRLHKPGKFKNYKLINKR